jgi:hypothetical protein
MYGSSPRAVIAARKPETVPVPVALTVPAAAVPTPIVALAAPVATPFDEEPTLVACAICSIAFTSDGVSPAVGAPDRRPRTLPCGHAFCTDDIQKQILGNARRYADSRAHRTTMRTHTHTHACMHRAA